MVIIAIPQVDAEQDDVLAEGGGVAGVVGAAVEGMVGDIAIIDDIDEPPPQALKAAINKVQEAAHTHRQRAIVLGRFIPSMEVLPVSQPLCE